MKLDKLSTSEKATIWIFLNSDIKLSYDDLSIMLGHEIQTITNQMNKIRKKYPNIIKEQVDNNNLKRLYIPENLRSILLKEKLRKELKK